LTAPARWAFEDHTGDIAVVVEAPDAASLFEIAAQALFGVILDDPGAVEPRAAIPIRVEGAADREDLLVRFLSELLFLHDARGWVFRDVRVIALAAGTLEAEARGEPLDPARHAVARQVKAVTYHGLSIVDGPRGLSVRVVFDL
jgi:SHS2 domain-containing protein